MSAFVRAALPPAEAKKLAKNLRRGRTFRVMVQNPAPVAGQPDRVFSTCASIYISHGDAMKYIDEAYGSFAAQGALVPISYCDTLLFIG
jgi:hypothetical protein